MLTTYLDLYKEVMYDIHTGILYPADPSQKKLRTMDNSIVLINPGVLESVINNVSDIVMLEVKNSKKYYLMPTAELLKIQNTSSPTKEVFDVPENKWLIDNWKAMPLNGLQSFESNSSVIQRDFSIYQSDTEFVAAIKSLINSKRFYIQTDKATEIKQLMLSLKNSNIKPIKEDKLIKLCSLLGIKVTTKISLDDNEITFPRNPRSRVMDSFR